MDFKSSPLPLLDNGFSMVPPDPPGTSEEEVERLKEELKMWKERVEEAEKVNADLVSKASADKECARAELTELKEQDKEQKDRIATFEQELFLLNQEKAELKEEIEKLKEEYSSRENPVKEFVIRKKVAEMKLKFSHLEDVKDGWADMDTQCVFGAATKIPFRLHQNQALLTFEDEEVAHRLTEMSKHSVDLDSTRADVAVKPFELETGFQFELQVSVSGRKINVSEIPELPIPKDWMRDKLELNFSKTEQGGGGEIENVTYDKEAGTAVITFLKPGASNTFVGCPKYPFFAEGRCFKLFVSPNFDVHLGTFQPYRGVSKKTILLKGIPEVEEDEESVQDMIEIHFQKPSNGGGELEEIKYVSKGAAYVCFEEDTGNATLEITGNS